MINEFDTTLTSGFFWDLSETYVIKQPSSEYVCNDKLIMINGGDGYRIVLSRNLNGYIGFLDNNQNKIRFITFNNTHEIYITTNTNEVYLAINLLTTDTTVNVNIQNNNRCNNFVHQILSRYANKNIACFGDSITYLDDMQNYFGESEYMIGYVTHLKRNLGANVFNHGVRGDRSDEIVSRLVSFSSYSEFDVVTLMCGTNDCIQQRAIGTINDADTEDTFYGSLKKAINHMAYYTSCRFLLIAPIYLAKKDSENNWLDIRPYAEAMENIGSFYGIPVLRLDKLSGINPVTYDSLTYDGIHPNNKANVFIGNCISNFILNN